MRVIKNFLVTLVVICALAGGGYYVYNSYFNAPEATNVVMEEAKITDVAPMLRLCSVEIYEDIPVKGKVGDKHLFGKMTVNGSISFDLDSLQITETADTLSMTLPREIVEVYESTAPGSYKVIDEWSDGMFSSSEFTNAEENKIKTQVRNNFRKTIYAKGYVERARLEASENLKGLLESVTGKTVIVTDPTPKGSL